MPGMAGGPGRGGNTVEPGEDLGAEPTNKRDVERIRQAVMEMSIEHDTIAECRLQPAPELVSEGTHSFHGRKIACELTGLAKPDGQQGALRACAPTAFMAGPVDERLERGASPHIECSNTLGGINLVAGNAEQVDPEGVHVRNNLSHRLCSVGVQENVVLARDAAHLGDWLDSPHLVVGVHDADEHRPRPNRLAYVIGIDTAKAI